jgi:hypothetical protein
MWNPLQWIKLLSLIKSLIDMGVAAVQWVASWWRARKEAKRAKEVDQAVEDLKYAKTEEEFDDAENRVVSNK